MNHIHNDNHSYPELQNVTETISPTEKKKKTIRVWSSL